MSTRINTNLSAMVASHSLDINSANESTDIQQLSTGLRINSAADSPAGLVISQQMNAQLVGLTQAASNTNDAINLTKTAEGALSQEEDLLTSMRQLAVAASNSGVNDSNDLAADQAQIASAISSINRISATTQFGTKNLLNGAATSAVTVTTTGPGTPGTPSTAVANNNGLDVLAQGTWTTGTSGTYTGASVSAATAASSSIGLGASTVGGSYSGSISFNGGATITLGSHVSLATVNGLIHGSGYQMSESTSGVTFTSLTQGSQSAPYLNESNFNCFTAGGTQTFDDGSGQQVNGTDTTLTLNGGPVNEASTSSVNNGDGTSTYAFANGLSITATSTPGTVKDSTGTTASTLTTAGTSGSGPTTSSSTGTSLEFQLGANAGQTTALSIQSTAADQIGQNAATYTDASGNTQTVSTTSVANIDVTTFKGAQDAIAVIDKAISDISSIRAGLGAFQDNVLQSNVNTLSTAQTNLTASKSAVTDADLAATVVQYTKDSILVQSSTSALSYANQMPQSILKLLQ